MFWFHRLKKDGSSADDRANLSLLLDDWCRVTGTARSDAAFEGMVVVILDLHAAGLSCKDIRQKFLPALPESTKPGLTLGS